MSFLRDVTLVDVEICIFRSGEYEVSHSKCTSLITVIRDYHDLRRVSATRPRMLIICRYRRHGRNNRVSRFISHPTFARTANVENSRVRVFRVVLIIQTFSIIAPRACVFRKFPAQSRKFPETIVTSATRRASPLIASRQKPGIFSR